MTQEVIFNKIERLKLIANCIKGATGIFGGSLILAEGHPYLALSILATGAVANEFVSSLREKENKRMIQLNNIVANGENKPE